jgi:GTP cyclohydrolase II
MPDACGSASGMTNRTALHEPARGPATSRETHIRCAVESRLLTNNSAKVVGLQGFGLEITERVPIEAEPKGRNERYPRRSARGSIASPRGSRDGRAGQLLRSRPEEYVLCVSMV